MMAVVIAAFAGALFGVGLLVSGMADPANVIAFLDVTGRWDPALALVMGGAILVYAPVVRYVRGRRAPWWGERFHWPELAAIDARLIGGAVVFGVGWGLSGYCPGPALVTLGSGARGAVVFVAAMLVGIVVTRLALRSR